MPNDHDELRFTRETPAFGNAPHRADTPVGGLAIMEIAKLDWEAHHGADVDLSDIYEDPGVVEMKRVMIEESYDPNADI